MATSAFYCLNVLRSKMKLNVLKLKPLQLSQQMQMASSTLIQSGHDRRKVPKRKLLQGSFLDSSMLFPNQGQGQLSSILMTFDNPNNFSGRIRFLSSQKKSGEKKEAKEANVPEEMSIYEEAVEKLKQAFNQYGVTIIIFHNIVGFLFIYVVYKVLSTGLALACFFGEKALLRPDVVSEGDPPPPPEGKPKSVLSNPYVRLGIITSALIGTYLAIRASQFRRIMLTLAATPYIVSFLRKIGLFKK